MKIQPFGDISLLISFEEEISESTNQKVISLFQILKQKEGISFQIPAYHSLTVGIDQTYWTLNEATIHIREQASNLNDQTGISNGNQYVIPVCYENEFAPDLEEIAQNSGLNKHEVIEQHSSKTYRVFMLGFIAGFAYMGTLNDKLKSPRKANPRLKVPTGSVGLAGLQTGIYPTEAPGGWQIIGRTPLDMFDPQRDQPTLLLPGDQVSFRPIGIDEFQIIRLKIETGIFEMEVVDA